MSEQQAAGPHVPRLRERQWSGAGSNSREKGQVEVDTSQLPSHLEGQILRSSGLFVGAQRRIISQGQNGSNEARGIDIATLGTKSPRVREESEPIQHRELLYSIRKWIITKKKSKEDKNND